MVVHAVSNPESQTNSNESGRVLNLFFRVVGVLVAFVLIVLLIGTLIPRDYSTSSSIVIKAPPAEIFPQVNTIKMWSNWSMWSSHEIPDLKMEYSGSEAGVGGVQKWTEVRGQGKMWITESLENERVNFSSTFSNFPEMQSSIQLTAVDGGTLVEWTSEGSLPSGPFYGWFGLTFADSLSLQYKKSLERLKQQVEANLVTD